jgi:hypothetical protein
MIYLLLFFTVFPTPLTLYVFPFRAFVVCLQQTELVVDVAEVQGFITTLFAYHVRASGIHRTLIAPDFNTKLTCYVAPVSEAVLALPSFYHR